MWQDNYTSSSNSSRENEEANLCLMVGYESTSSVSSIISMSDENYNSLLKDFKETHEQENVSSLK